MTVTTAVKQDEQRINRPVRMKSSGRILSTVLATSAICCFAVTASYYSDTSDLPPDHTQPGYMVELDVVSIVALSLSVIWNAGNFLHERVAHRPIHPGARVAFELLLWLGQVLVAIAVATGTISYYSSPAKALNSVFQGLQYSGIVMLIVTCLLMFILFVYACRDTHIHRRNRRKCLKCVSDVELVPTIPLPTSVIVACDCRYHLEHDHVAGGPNDTPPQYLAAAGEWDILDQGK